jgi:hypothetical protein
MHAGARDNVPTLAAIGLIAYVTADLAHHAFGHGAACVIEGARINRLSSILVACSRTGAAIDLAGPSANLALGLLAAWGIHFAHRLSTARRLFCILLAAFNLMWFALQLAYSALTRKDDWAWPIHEWQVTEPVRYGLIATGALLYIFIIRFIGGSLAPFARPVNRARIIVRTAWLSAGAIACATAAFDHHPAGALRVAAAQSLLLSAGILFAPRHAARAALPEDHLPVPLALSIAWIAPAIIIALLSAAFLGPGIDLSR